MNNSELDSLKIRDLLKVPDINVGMAIDEVPITLFVTDWQQPPTIY